MKNAVWVSLVVAALGQPPSAAVDAADVSRLTVAPPVRVSELDLGKLKGSLRRLSWSPDKSELYVQTDEQTKASEHLYHHVVALATGAIVDVPQEPGWAAEYWSMKSDRTAPGMPSLVIDVEQKMETVKIGTGSAGVADRTSNPLGAENINSGTNVERAAESQKVSVVRLLLVGETVSEFVNERPLPGVMFSWGPSGSGAIAFTDREGHLTLLDSHKRKRHVQGVKDASMPAWSTDGTRLAFLRRTGRNKYALEWSAIH